MSHSCFSEDMCPFFYFFILQVYWGGPASAGVVAALLYNYLLAPSDEPFNEKTRVLFCGGSSLENEIREPILENIKGAKWSKEPV